MDLFFCKLNKVFLRTYMFNSCHIFEINMLGFNLFNHSNPFHRKKLIDCVGNISKIIISS